MNLTQRAENFLHAHHVVTLATSGHDGPWASAVFYAADGTDLIFVSSPRSRHSQNFTGSVAGAIHENVEDWELITGIQLEGEVEELSGTSRDQAMAHYQQRFAFTKDGASDAIAVAITRISLYRLRSRVIHLIDNSQGFGHRETLEVGDLKLG